MNKVRSRDANRGEDSSHGKPAEEMISKLPGTTEEAYGGGTVKRHGRELEGEHRGMMSEGKGPRGNLATIQRELMG